MMTQQHSSSLSAIIKTQISLRRNTLQEGLFHQVSTDLKTTEGTPENYSYNPRSTAPRVPHFATHAHFIGSSIRTYGEKWEEYFRPGYH